MLVGMVFGRFAGVMCRMKRVPLSDMRVVRRFLVIAGFMVGCAFAMMGGCLFVVFCCLLVVLGTFVGCHKSPVLATTALDGFPEANPKNPRAIQISTRTLLRTRDTLMTPARKPWRSLCAEAPHHNSPRRATMAMGLFSSAPGQIEFETPRVD